MGKKKNNRCPRRKRLTRPLRLNAARKWIETYTGKYIAKSYAKWFGVDLLSAIRELRSLGVMVSEEYEEAIKRNIKNRVEERKRLKEKRAAEQEMEAITDWNDDQFAYIAGYTAAGFPYGTTWEEMGVYEDDDYTESLT